MAETRYGALAAFIAAPLLVALTASRAESLRPLPPELRADASLEVISARDTGGGTLREAITAAARHQGRVRIVIRPSRITLLSPLPPLVNPNGVVVDASESRCQLDASGIGDIPALDITSPGTTISGLRIVNARDAAILVRAARATIRNVVVSNSDDGVVLSGARNSVVEGSTFERNGNGVRLEGDSMGAVIRGCAFRNHDAAAVWAVRGARSNASLVRIENNTFRDDRTSIVIVNVDARIARNDIRGATENAIYLLQSRSTVVSNRILGGAAGGILADRADGVRMEQNEIDHNGAVAIMVRSSRNNAIRRNVIYANGYGIASIFGDRTSPNVVAENLVMNHRVDGLFIVGSSPLLRANRLLQNAGAAARVLDFVPWTGPRVASNPRFEGNTLTGNALDAVRGEYRPKRVRESP